MVLPVVQLVILDARQPVVVLVLVIVVIIVLVATQVVEELVV